MKNTGTQTSNQPRVIIASLLILLVPLSNLYGRAKVFEPTQQSNSDINQQVQGQSGVRRLEVSKLIERELKGGESHTYTIALTAGQYLSAIVDQRGIDLKVIVTRPDGEQMFAFDSESRKQGQEMVTVVAEAPGSYRLDVQPVINQAAAGRYEIRLAELRAATEQDGLLQEARKLYDESVRLRGKGQYDAALSGGERALAIREKVSGPEHPDVAQSLHHLANLYSDKGGYAKAEPLFQRALGIREKVLGPEHPDVATSLNNLANLYKDKGDYAKAEPLYQRALAIREKALGPDHPDVGGLLTNLALLYRAKGDYAEAESLYLRALAIREKALGPDHRDVASTLYNLALLYKDKGDYAKAEPLYQRALVIFEKALGPDHPIIAYSLNSLANLYTDKGDYAKAEPLFQRALVIREKALGPEHPLVAFLLHNLAILYFRKGDHAKAEPLYQRALSIKEKALGPDHPDVANSLYQLAFLYSDVGDFAKAEPLYQRALAIRERALGPDHPLVASSLNNLANLYLGKGDHAKAEAMYQRAMVIWEKALGPDYPDVANSLNNLAHLYFGKGDYAKAEPLYQRALSIKEKALGPDHPDVAGLLYNLALLYSDEGEPAKAVDYLSRSVKVSEHNIVLNLNTGSERQKLLYLDTLWEQANYVISLHAQSAPANAQALSLAVATILQRKGRTLEAMADSMAALRRRANLQDREVIDQLTDARTRLSTLVFGGPGNTKPAEYRAEIKKLEEKVDELEAGISRRSAEFRAQSQPATLAAVQAAIPMNAALVEFVSYYPYNPKAMKAEGRYGQPHYVAYVLGNTGEPRWADLGEAKAIDGAIYWLRAALRDPENKDVKQLAREVDEKVMRPVRKLLGQTRRVLLSPDGALNLVPFAALVDEKNRYLVEQYSFSYLTSGRDLLHLQEKLPSRQGVMVLADPDFGGDMTTCSESRTSAPRDAVDFSKVLFCPLVGTAGEAQAIKGMMPEASVLTKAQATEVAIKQVSGPKVLHVATHGFFLEDVVINPSAGGRDLSHKSNPSGAAMNVNNPLLRSGLAMAGANLHKSGDDDGVLTAFEAAALDLWGTKLVVLSACDTGVGEVRNGDGVYGLRRALVLAGSESQVMSLWPVSDKATRDLMIEYYKALKAGQGRGEAMRQVQLTMLASKARQHPYFWASFIQSGEWANLDGKR